MLPFQLLHHLHRNETSTCEQDMRYDRTTRRGMSTSDLHLSTSTEKNIFIR